MTLRHRDKATLFLYSHAINSCTTEHDNKTRQAIKSMIMSFVRLVML